MKEKILQYLMIKASNALNEISPLLNRLEIEECYLAGGCFSDEVRDYDLFPVNQGDFDKLKGNPESKFHSKNAVTFIPENKRIQFCDYYWDSLEGLINSFDFSHTKVGAHIKKISEGYYIIEKIYYEDSFEDYLITRKTQYLLAERTGVELDCAFPLASLIRAEKYKSRGLMTKTQYADSVIKILNVLLKRGFKDYADFKNQLDSVDLAFITGNPYNGTEPDESEILIEWEPLIALYEMLKGGCPAPSSEAIKKSFMELQKLQQDSEMKTINLNEFFK